MVSRMAIPRAVAVVVDGGRALVIKRYLRLEAAGDCAMCRGADLAGPECPGHDYAVLPGGHVEEGETAEVAAVRELSEETTLTAGVDRLLRTSTHTARPATYFLMTDVAGTPQLSGPEAEAHNTNNHFELLWAAPDEFAELGLYPADVRALLTDLLQPSS